MRVSDYHWAIEESMKQQNISRPEDNSSLSFSDVLQIPAKDESIKEPTEIEKMEKLVKDIKSVIRTGATEEEWERIQKLLQSIQEELKNAETPDDIEAVEAMAKELQKMVDQLKRRITGEAIEKAEENKPEAVQSDTSHKNLDGVQRVMTQLQKVNEELNSIIEGKEKKKEFVHNPSQYERITASDIELFNSLKTQDTTRLGR